MIYKQIKRKLGVVMLAMTAFFISAFSIEAQATTDVSVEEQDVIEIIYNELDYNTLETFEELDQYIFINDYGMKVFDEQTAIENKVSDHLLNIGYRINQLNTGATYSAPGQNYTMARLNFHLLVYGNYCGKGNKGGRPIDDLDTACMYHDRCYVWGGNNSACNKRFIRRLLRVIQTTYPWEYKHQVAVAAVKLFS